jgi:serine protease Do
MRIHEIGFPGRALVGAGVLGLLVVTSPVVHGQEHGSVFDLRGIGTPGPEIGVSVRDVTADDGAGATRAGAVVERVRGESPAAKAGVQAGDVIVTYDGESVRSARQLARLIDETPQDQSVALTITRSGTRMDLSVTPQARSPWGAALATPTPFESPDLNLMVQPRSRSVAPGLLMPAFAGRLGIQTQDLTTQLGEYFGASGGVLVTSVGDNTVARTAGLKAGDVITEVDGQDVQNAAALRQRLAGKTGPVALTVVRDRNERTLKVELQSATRTPVAPRRYER